MNLPEDIRKRLHVACADQKLDPAVIEPLARPAVRLETKSTSDADIPVGASKLGGDPDLPEDIDWPMADDRPLAFIAQIDLAEAHACVPLEGLPSEGKLSFFYDALAMPWGIEPTDKGHWRISYLAPGAKLVRRSRPQVDTSGHDDLHGVAELKPCTVQMSAIITWPDSDGGHELKANGLDWHVCAAVFEAATCEVDDPPHAIGGYAQSIQGEMRDTIAVVAAPGEVVIVKGVNPFTGEEIETAQAKPDPDDPKSNPVGWKHLLTVASDDVLGATWGDCGCIYFWAFIDDIESRTFEHTWVELQCY